MLITLFDPPGSPSDFYLRVSYGEARALYQCVTVTDFPTNHYCSGAPIALGTSITIEIRETKGNALLARGDFVLNGLALPTVFTAGSPTPMNTFVTPAPLGTVPTEQNSAPEQNPTPAPGEPSVVTPGTEGTPYPNP